MNTMSAHQAFANALLDPAHAVPAGLRVPHGLDCAHRFDVHRNNITVALVEALASTFPVTRALVGDDCFHGMAVARIRADPPRSPVLADSGEGFADFIAGFAPVAGLPYLADMARLEQARVQAYHAADAAPVAITAYQALLPTPERLASTRVRLHPACRWLRSRHAVHSLWQAHQLPDAQLDAALAAVELDRPEAILLTRPHWDVVLTALPIDACAWLQALANGATLYEAALLADDGDSASLETLLQLLIHHDLAVALQSPPE